MMKIVKRNGDLVDFNSNKIYNAIMDSMVKGSSIIMKRRDLYDENHEKRWFS